MATAKSKDSTKYYDIVLIGKTGQGKSTTGNKLLDMDLATSDDSKVTEFSSAHLKTTCKGKTRRFDTADDLVRRDAKMFSVTETCQLLANESKKIRVLDVPGFSDSGKLGVSVYQGNLQIFRWIVQVQLEKKLKVQRILYFLPIRGPMEKADGTLQEELKVMNHFFGASCFDCLVMVATQAPKKKYQSLEFDQMEIDETKAAFHGALKQVVDDKNIECPPLIVIKLDNTGDMIMEKVRSAKVLKESILPLRFRDDICASCSLKIRYSDNEGQKKMRVGVVRDDNDDELVPYAESKCHPAFVQKYSTSAKFFGGVAHAMTFGTGLLYSYITEKESWPGFTNSDEMCPHCSMAPGSLGCSLVTQSIKCSWIEGARNMTAYVDHTNEINES